MTLPQMFYDVDVISSFMLSLSYIQSKGLPEGRPISVEEIRYEIYNVILHRLTYKGSLFNNPCIRTVVTHI